MWRHLHAHYNGMGPELVQRTVAELLMVQRAATMAELQPALLRLKEQLRDVVVAGHALGDTQCTIALRGIIPRGLLERLDGVEDHHPTCEATLRWVGR